jgi:1-acyl-sn-glycerol-3-phosphate acyltransferase
MIGEEVLNKDGLLVIFPEGTSRVERNLLPLKKGVSRIVMQAMQRRPDKPLYIVPVGIHYSRHAFRSDLQLITGDPVPGNPYSELYGSSPAKAINQLTEELEEHFEKVVLYVDQAERTAVLENSLRMADNDQGKHFTEADFCKQKLFAGKSVHLTKKSIK